MWKDKADEKQAESSEASGSNLLPPRVGFSRLNWAVKNFWIFLKLQNIAVKHVGHVTSEWKWWHPQVEEENK